MLRERPTESLPSGYRPRRDRVRHPRPTRGASRRRGGRTRRAHPARGPRAAAARGRSGRVDRSHRGRALRRRHPGDRGDAGASPGLRAAARARRGGDRDPAARLRRPRRARGARPAALRGAVRAALEEAEPAEAVAALDEALALWRGDALADLAREPFAQRPIARLEELRLRAWSGASRRELALGRHADAIGELTRSGRRAPACASGCGSCSCSPSIARAARSRRSRSTARRGRRSSRPSASSRASSSSGSSRRSCATTRSCAPEAARSTDRAGAVLVAGRDLARVHRLAELAAPLARRPGHELIVALLLAHDDGPGRCDGGARGRPGTQRRADARGGVRLPRRGGGRAPARAHLRRGDSCSSRRRRGSRRAGPRRTRWWSCWRAARRTSPSSRSGSGRAARAAA